MRACGSRCLSCIIIVRLKESVIRSAMSSHCWSLPHFLSSSPQHETPPGQHDLLRDDTVKGSSASQVTAAQVMDIISRLLGCSGQADAVSAYAQVKVEDAITLVKIPKSECFAFLDTCTKAQMAKVTVQYGRSSRSSRKEICTVIFCIKLAGITENIKPT